MTQCVRTLDLADARQIIAAGERRAAELKVPYNIAVVDCGGGLIAHERMDGAWLGSIDIAICKAWTARAFEMSTETIASLTQSGQPGFGLNTTNGSKVVIFGGGIPISVNGIVIGAVGASGGSVEQDIAVARAAAAGLSGLTVHPGQEPPLGGVQVEQRTYEIPPREGISIAHFLTVTDIERSARYYERVFGARILSMGDGDAPAYLQLANIWMILNVGGGPTPDKPTVTLGIPDPGFISSFMNIRVADIQACHEQWKSLGAEFITEPIPKYGETRCYIRDPDGYIIEVGQSSAEVKYG